MKTQIAILGLMMNQIDHIAIPHKCRKSLLDVRSDRGADVASDHYLVIGQIRIRLAAKKKPTHINALNLTQKNETLLKEN